jgi:hypothetical protein
MSSRRTLHRHCERSEAIHGAAKKVWIASSQGLLAMTVKSEILPPFPPAAQRQPVRQIRHGAIEAAEQDDFKDLRIVVMRR